MGTLSPLGIAKMADSDSFADVAQWIRDAVDGIDALLTGRAAAWNQAAVAVGAGATVAMGSAAIPAISRLTTLHIGVLNDNTAAAANILTLTPGYENTRLVNLGAIRWGNGASSSQQLHFMSIPLNPGTSAVACSFTLHATAALDAGRVLTWIT